MTDIMDLFAQAPKVIGDISEFYTWPHHFGEGWRLGVIPHASAAVAITWVLAFTALAVGLYKIALRSSLLRGIRGNEPEAVRSSSTQTTKESPAARPQILRFFIVERSVLRSVKSGEITGRETQIGTGIKVGFPEQASKSFREPQLIVIKMGMVNVLIRAIPAKFKKRFFQAGFILWLALSSVFFLHPLAAQFGGLASFSQSLQMTIAMLSYAFLAFAFVAAVQWLTVKRVDKPATSLAIGLGVLGAGVIIWQLVACIVAFAGLYGLSLGWMVLATLIGLIAASVASLVTTPLVFTPLLYLSLRFSALLDLLSN
jgi:hypothetical protein